MDYVRIFILIVAIFVLIAVSVYFSLPNSKERAKIRKEQEVVIRKKEANLKEIYASMAEFDRLIAERDAAYASGDRKLYEAKVREASKCYEDGNKLFKN